LAKKAGMENDQDIEEGKRRIYGWEEA